MYLKSLSLPVFILITQMILDRSFQTRRQLYRHFAEVHGDYLECNFCRFTLPGTRKYLMVRHLKNKHPDKPVLYCVERREAFHNDASASLVMCRGHSTGPHDVSPLGDRPPRDPFPELRQPLRLILDESIKRILQPPQPSLHLSHH